MKRKNSVFARVCMILALIFMYAPILVLIIFSFNDSKSRTVWTLSLIHILQMWTAFRPVLRPAGRSPSDPGS